MGGRLVEDIREFLRPVEATQEKFAAWLTSAGTGWSAGGRTLLLLVAVLGLHIGDRHRRFSLAKYMFS